jgi:hypothetical protein
MDDFGYDISDYTGVDPVFGTLDDLDRLVAAAHGRGLRVLLDWVPNHTSDRHPEGLHAGLIVPVMLPAGTTGDSDTMTATVSTSSPEWSLANNSGQVSLRYVTPEPADLQIIDMSPTPAQVVAGEQIEIALHVENIGGSPADDVRVRVPLPDTVEPVSADLTGPDWTCSVVPDAETGQRVWECAHPWYEPHSIECLSRIILTATVGAGTPEGTLRFVATAGTDSPELSTDNNAGEASTTYRAQGFIAPGRYFVRVSVSSTLDFTVPDTATRPPTPTSRAQLAATR